MDLLELKDEDIGGYKSEYIESSDHWSFSDTSGGSNADDAKTQAK